MVTLLAVFNNRSAASKSNNNSKEGEGFAVLELFTSEGCSSCPAADALLNRVQQNAGDKPIYVLSYHVDYWDRMGWKDVFSNARYSKRQYQYSQQFTGQVYTPQVIINGKAECIGSDEPALTGAINNALSTAAAVSLHLQATQQAGKMNVNYQVTGNTADCQLLIALVQKHAVSKVARGENQGRTLNHAQIVRDFSTFNLPSSKKGTAHISLPAEYNTNDWEVIGLVQDSASGVIMGAARAATAQDAAAL